MQDENEYRSRMQLLSQSEPLFQPDERERHIPLQFLAGFVDAGDRGCKFFGTRKASIFARLNCYWACQYIVYGQVHIVSCLAIQRSPEVTCLAIRRCPIGVGISPKRPSTHPFPADRTIIDYIWARLRYVFCLDSRQLFKRFDRYKLRNFRARWFWGFRCWAIHFADSLRLTKDVDYFNHNDRISMACMQGEV